MDPDRKRKIRLVVALSAAVLLATALVYTSFSASTEREVAVRAAGRARPPAASRSTARSSTARLPTTALSSASRSPTREDSSAAVPVDYEGQVPDPFREGRDVIVTGEMVDGTLVAEKDSLITKCPSKFSDEAAEDPDHVVIDDIRLVIRAAGP